MTEADEITLAELRIERKRLEEVRDQAQEQVELQEAAFRSIRDMVEDVAGSKELQLHVVSIIDTKRVLILDCIENFQRVRTLEDALSLYTILVNLCRFFLRQKPEILTEHENNIISFKKTYMGWFEEYRLSHRIRINFFSRVMKPEIFTAFYQIVDILLNIQLITADDIVDYKTKIVPEMDKALKRYPDYGKDWGEGL